MTMRGFYIRLRLIAVITWLLVSFTDSPGWALFTAVLPIVYYEMLRPR